MKKTFAVFILLIFAFNITGMYIPFYLVRSFIRDEMNERAKEDIKAESLVKFTFSAKEIQEGFTWSRNGREFEFGNKMYDIVKTETSGDKVVYYCLRDNDETNLNNIFNVLVKKDNEKNTKGNINFTKVLSKFNLSTNSIIIHSPHPAFQSARIRYFYQSLHNEVISPPPERFLLVNHI